MSRLLLVIGTDTLNSTLTAMEHCDVILRNIPSDASYSVVSRCETEDLRTFDGTEAKVCEIHTSSS